MSLATDTLAWLHSVLILIVIGSFDTKEEDSGNTFRSYLIYLDLVLADGKLAPYSMGPSFLDV